MLNQNWYIVNKKHPRTPGIRNGSNHMMGCDCNCTWYQPSPSLASYFYKFSHNFTSTNFPTTISWHQFLLAEGSRSLCCDTRKPCFDPAGGHLTDIQRAISPLIPHLNGRTWSCLVLRIVCPAMAGAWRWFPVGNIFKDPEKKYQNTLETSLINPKVVHCQSLREESY